MEKELVHSKEKLYFTLVVIASIAIYLAFIVSIVGIIILLISIGTFWIMHLYTIISIRKNGVKLSEHQFPEFYEKAVILSKKMNMEKTPDIYVIESGGLLNAFATKFGLKNMVVLYSDIFALIEERAEDEVFYILAHEFAHVKRRHVGYSWILMPGLSVPFLSSAYSRACEFTCDRYGAYYTNSFEGAKNALTILAVGPILYKKVNKEAFIQQINQEAGVFSWFDEITSTHPNLPRRLHALDLFFNPENAQNIKPSKKGFVLGILALILFFAILFGASIFVGMQLYKWLENLEVALVEDTPDFDELEFYETESMNDLMLAVLDYNVSEVEKLAQDQKLLSETNSEGYTALHLAVIENQEEILEILLKAGSPIETIDKYGYSPLYEAIYYEDLETTELLLEYGASPESFDGIAIELTQESGYEKFQELLNQY